MATKCYNYERESDRAKNLQRMTELIVQKNELNESTDSASSCDISFEEEKQDAVGLRVDDDDVLNNNQNTKLRNVANQKSDVNLIKKFDDWGKEHPEYNNMGDKIPWSRFEKEYIKESYNKYHLMRNKWRLCLDDILNADVNVRQQFHIKHLSAVKIKDSMRH
jgi:hypothetical protein